MPPWPEDGKPTGEVRRDPAAWLTLRRRAVIGEYRGLDSRPALGFLQRFSSRIRERMASRRSRISAASENLRAWS